MKKPPLQDVIVMRGVQRTGIHDMRNQTMSHGTLRHQPSVVPARRSANLEHERHQQSHFEPEQEHHRSVPRERRSPWLAVALVSGAALVGSAFALSLVFSGASVTVYPKRDTVVADIAFTASTNDAIAEFAASMVTFERKAVREVQAQSEMQVEEPASGVITVYNEYSKSPQTLLKFTRFKADDGKIYKIHEKLVVPGQHEDGTPGSIEATVYAEVSGESYNRGPGSFSIPGFEKRPQEGKIYAKSTSDISGGFEGIRRVVLEKDRIASYEALETQLRDELRSAVLEDGVLPEGAWVDPDSVFFEFNPLPDELSAGESVLLSLSGKVHAVAFDKATLDRFIAARSVTGFVDAPVEVVNRADLSIMVEPQLQGTSTPPVAPWLAGIYTVSVKGKAEFVWHVDEIALKQSLLGVDKNLLMDGVSAEIRAEHPGVDRMNVISRPFWMKYLPKNAEDIELTLELDEE